MLPNSLLVHQVHQVLSELVRDTGMRVDMVDNIETQEMPDVVIGTPQKLLSKFDVYNLNFKVDVFQNIAYLVLDEADQLVEQTSEACLRRFLALANKRVKTILAAATVSTAGRRSTKNSIDRLFKNLTVRSTDRVHALPTNLEPNFVYCTGYEQKVEKLLEILGEMKPQQRALVFCGTVKSSEALYDILKKTHRHLDVGLINRCVDVETQLAVVDEQHGNKVIICTDLLARGIDIPRVSTVVQFDFPTNVLDYIHRSGRAGRNMQRCKASLLWTDADRDFFTLLSDNHDNLPALFSRKRGLRKRLKRGLPVGDTPARSGGEDLNDKM
ncbi:helicase, putative [Babesia bigemina]|uniref:ATP-dependent RNA helicase n=1 Tax=Babesia bigemina TaxID=5866 RepID=A0A061D9B7_BABBI|nr:helicase, putative [Babesia bigemina]CDR94290.1 helicase, putative [Babesia bigemina]|eukprot:XP_012766476.1 helicase, putative [Babesia bigemina]